MSTKYVLLVLVLVTMVQTVKTNTTGNLKCKTDQGFTCEFPSNRYTKDDEPCITWFSCKVADYPEEKCFPTSKFCDGKSDCEDESDEIGCNCSAPIRYTLSAILREQHGQKHTSIGGNEKQFADIQSKLDAIEELITSIRNILIVVPVLSFIIIVGLAVYLKKRQSLTSASQMPRSVSSPTDPGSPGQMPSSDSSPTDPGSPGQMPSIDSPLLTSESPGRSQESHCDSRPVSLRTKVNQI